MILLSQRTDVNDFLEKKLTIVCKMIFVVIKNHIKFLHCTYLCFLLFVKLYLQLSFEHFSEATLGNSNWVFDLLLINYSYSERILVTNLELGLAIFFLLSWHFLKVVISALFFLFRIRKACALILGYFFCYLVVLSIMLG
jgi:hypothetical protein